MKAVPLKTVLRTPKELAKNAMKQQALSELASAQLATQAQVDITYMGIKHTVPANVTCNVENGQIMFHFGAVGKSRLPFEIRVGDKSKIFSMGLGGNLMTGEAIDNWEDIRTKYNLKTEAVEAKTEDDVLSEGEST